MRDVTSFGCCDRDSCDFFTEGRFCEALDKAGVPRHQKWRTLILYMRGLAVHAVSFMLVDGEQHVDLHAEVAGEERLEVAHERVSAFEADLARTLGKATVVTHIEPVAVREDALPEASNEALTAVEGVVHSLLDAEPDVDDCHNMRLHRLGDELSLSFHCRMSPETPVSVAHEAATRLEKSLRARLGDISRVAIHMEPTPRNHQA